MALSEQEELELLTLEKQKALGGGMPPAPQVAAAPKPQSLKERIGSNLPIGIGETPENKRLSNVSRNAAVEGLAGIPDMFMNAPSNLYNLGKAAVGVGMSAAGVDPSKWPEVSAPPSYTSQLARKLGATSAENEPKDAKERLLASAIQSGIGMMVPGGALNAGRNAAVGVLSGIAGQGTKEATGSDLAALAVSALTPAVVRGGASVLRSGAEGLMEHAINPTLSDLQKGKVSSAIDTFLEKGIGPTKKGIAALKTEGTILNDAASAELRKAQGRTVSKNTVLSELQPLISDVEKKNMMPQALRAEIERVYDEIATNPLVPNRIPVTQANDFKRTLQQEMKNKYGTVSEGEDLAKKTIAASLRNEIEGQVPAVGPINAEASKIWNAVNVGERRALLHGKEQPIGIGVLSGNAGLAAAYAAQRNPWILSRLANMLNPGKALTQPVPTQARLIQNALMAKQLENQGEE